MVVNASNTDQDLAWIQEHAKGMDVTIEDQTDELAMLALQGPGSEAVLQKLVSDLDLSGVKYYKSGFGTLSGMPNIRISRTGYTGEDGFEIYFPDGESETHLERVGPSGSSRRPRPYRLRSARHIAPWKLACRSSGTSWARA